MKHDKKVDDHAILRAENVCRGDDRQKIAKMVPAQAIFGFVRVRVTEMATQGESNHTMGGNGDTFRSFLMHEKKLR